MGESRSKLRVSQPSHSTVMNLGLKESVVDTQSESPSIDIAQQLKIVQLSFGQNEGLDMASASETLTFFIATWTHLKHKRR